MEHGINEVFIRTDGASRGNPGPSSIGVVISDAAGRLITAFAEKLPPTTNNVAEYTALIRALEEARGLGAKAVHCLMDSQLVAHQVNGRYKVKHPGVRQLHARVTELARTFDVASFDHIPRELNTQADNMANLILGSPRARSSVPAASS
jgi:ribonuclease HI